MAKRNLLKFSYDTRQTIKRLYNYTCQECFKRKGTQIHHILPKSQGGHGVITNGILVCSKCHTKIHKSESLLRKWQDWATVNFGPEYWNESDYFIWKRIQSPESLRRANFQFPDVAIVEELNS